MTNKEDRTQEEIYLRGPVDAFTDDAVRPYLVAQRGEPKSQPGEPISLKLDLSKWSSSKIEVVARNYHESLETDPRYKNKEALVLERVMDFIQVTNRIRTPETFNTFVNESAFERSESPDNVREVFITDFNEQGPLKTYKTLADAAFSKIPPTYKGAQSDFDKPYYFIKTSPFHIFWQDIDEFKYGLLAYPTGRSFFKDINDVLQAIKK